MKFFYLVFLLLGIFFASSFFLPLYRQRKIKRRIRQEFGRAPVVGKGLTNSEIYWNLYLETEQPSFYVDHITWQDLDMDQLFYRLNGCASAVGDAALYMALRLPCKGEQAIAQQEQLIRLLAEHGDTRLAMQTALHILGRADGAALSSLRFRHKSLGLKNSWVYSLMAFLPLLAILIFFYNLFAGLLVLLCIMGINISVDFYIKTKFSEGFIAARYLSSMVGSAGKIAKIGKNQCPRLSEKLTACCLPLSGIKLSLAILRFNEMFNEGLGMFCPLSLFLLPTIAYGRVIHKISLLQAEVNALVEELGKADLAICILSLRKSLPIYCLPSFTHEKSVSFSALYHPMLEDVAVTNNGSFNGSVLVTGSNASGKSTFIKAIAINLITAQALNTCTAVQFSACPGKVATSMAMADNLSSGDSYFVAEIKSMRRLLHIAESGFSYFFIDEILKGTNTVERIAAAAALIRWLHRRNCICFAATHDIELTTLLAAQCTNIHFREEVGEHGIHFDYKLHSGPSRTRNALLLLGHTGFPAEITQSAANLAEHFEQTGKWSGQAIQPACGPEEETR